MGLFDTIGKGLKNLFGGGSDFLSGTPAEYSQVSNLTPEQLRTQKQLERASRKRGAGGAFGQSADYYRDILENDPSMLEALFSPEMRRFNEQIIPDLAEQYAGMGAGGLSSSGFQNSATRAGTDLSERLAMMRQNLRQQAAQGLSNLGSQALSPHAQYTQTNPGSEGFLSQVAPGLGAGIGMAFGGPIGGAIGGGLGSLFKGSQQPGTTSPYGSMSSQGNFNPYLGMQ